MSSPTPEYDDQFHNLDERSPEIYPEYAPKPRKLLWCIWIGISIVLATLIASGIGYYFNTPPSSFTATEITIPPGSTVSEIASIVANADVVRSATGLEVALRLTQDTTKIQAGTYRFSAPNTTLAVAEHLVSGDIVHELVSVTFVEGMRVRDYAVVAAESLNKVNEQELLRMAEGSEGKLFPETYFVPPDIATEELYTLLRDTHDEIIAPYQTPIEAQGLRVDDAIILASIIEREANTPESMRTVAGIFANRLAIGMALQADASIEYVIDPPLHELAPGQLAVELRELDSPYNTYLYGGLPPTPIGNPGETAIAAVANPIASDYLYYITGNDGEFYYAETYDQHLLNIERHLR